MMPQKKQIESQKIITTLVITLVLMGIFFLLIWNRQASLSQYGPQKTTDTHQPKSTGSQMKVDKVNANSSMDYILSKAESFRTSSLEERSVYFFVAEEMESGQVFRFRAPIKNHLQPAHNLVKFEYANFIGKDYNVRVMHQPGSTCADMLTDDLLIPYIQAYFKSGVVKNMEKISLQGQAEGKAWEMTENEKYKFGYIGCYPDKTNMLWRVEMLFASAVDKEESFERAADILNSFEFSE